MRIAIDIDDTIVNTSDSMKEYIERYPKYKECINDIICGNINHPLVVEFYDKYIDEIANNAKLKENVDVINELYKDNEIYFITARSERFIRDIDNKTKKYLDGFNISYHKIITCAGKKDLVCYENNIDLLIDDSVKHCMNASKRGIKVLLFNSDANANIEVDFKRVYNWKEVYEFFKS